MGWGKDASVVGMSLLGGMVALRSRWEVNVGTVFTVVVGRKLLKNLAQGDSGYLAGTC